jgi:hypothetical protein
MKSFAARLFAAVVAVVALMLLVGAATKKTTVLQADKLVILSTTDVKGKTSPCG